MSSEHATTMAGDKKPAEKRDLSTSRKAARARFNRMLHKYMESAAMSGETLASSWASRLEVSEQYVRIQGNTQHITGVLAAGDLEALDPVDLIALLEHWIEVKRAKLSPPKPATDPRMIALESMTRVGEIAEKATRFMANGECDAREWAEMEAQLEQSERHARAAKLAARAARERLMGGV